MMPRPPTLPLAGWGDSGGGEAGLSSAAEALPGPREAVTPSHLIAGK